MADNPDNPDSHEPGKPNGADHANSPEADMPDQSRRSPALAHEGGRDPKHTNYVGGFPLGIAAGREA